MQVGGGGQISGVVVRNVRKSGADKQAEKLSVDELATAFDDGAFIRAALAG